MATRIATHPRWGSFEFEHSPTETNPERVRVMGAWPGLNIVRVELPVYGHAWLHKLAVPAFDAFFQALAASEWRALVESRDGAWVTRFKRQNGTRAEREAHCAKLGAESLSNHCWGTAIDMNAAKLPLGRPLALDDPWWNVVRLAERHELTSGARYHKRPDAMHLELL